MFRLAAESTRYLVIPRIQLTFQVFPYRSPGFFEGLIGNVLSIWLLYKLGMEPDCGYGMSESDLEVVEEASRKGMRKAISKKQTLKQIDKLPSMTPSC